MEERSCFHCGDPVGKHPIHYDEKDFCCHGCKTVYQLFTENDLSCYYDLTRSPGAIPKELEGKYDFLSNEAIIEKLLEFDDGTTQVTSLYIPHIHCSSCIWVLENLQKLNAGIVASQVNFPKKTVRVTFKEKETSLKDLAVLLSRIGYEPYISLEDHNTANNTVDRSMVYKLGVAGFAFGNVMLLSFPEYFQTEGFWLDQYKTFFRWLMFCFSLPVVFYTGSSYFISAYKGIRSGFLNIDVPIALGILTLFLRSSYDIIFDLGSGFFDSLTGLVFFLLLGKFFQQQTYSFLSFERDYRSYFPIAITRLKKNGTEENIPVNEIEKGDLLLVRNEELIPVDGILIRGNAHIDYSFVTGEAVPIQKKSGDKVFAGGKQLSGSIELEAIRSVEQSYLTQLWSNDIFNKDKEHRFQTLTDAISKRFTIAVLAIAVISTSFWLYQDPSKALNVFTAVLIIACPCAIALSAPFTLGNLLRIFGKKKCYLKNTQVIERLAKIDTAIFDKTGTLTTHRRSNVDYHGITLQKLEEKLLKSALRSSNHPLSRSLYQVIPSESTIPLDIFEEYPGEGIAASYQDTKIKIGAASFAGGLGPKYGQTSVHIKINDTYKGYFLFTNEYRPNTRKLFQSLAKMASLGILSGDNEGEKGFLTRWLPAGVSMRFDQRPDDKLNYIKTLQEQGKTVLMVGDGLNDAGALAQSDVGISIAEDVNVFSPACDGIIDASMFEHIKDLIRLSKKGVSIIKVSFLLSLVYNITGLYFAVTGQLLPVIAAILMPLSSISIVVFTTVTTNWAARKFGEISMKTDKSHMQSNKPPIHLKPDPVKA